MTVADAAWWKYDRSSTFEVCSAMSTDPDQSKALQREVLKSESYRMIAVICLLSAGLVLVIARLVITQKTGLLIAGVVVLAFAIAYEAFMLSYVRSRLRNNDKFPTAVLALNLLVETQMPTLALVLLIQTGLMSPNRALVAPAMIAYFFFIIVSTLRLSPVLCLLTGLLSASGYVAVGLYASRSNPDLDWTFGSFALPYYFVYGLLIFASGGVAAFVAERLRVHVPAALREAELQNELERVNHDLDIARSIQQGLMPNEPPGLEEFEIAGWNQPADQTGGDYFDWQELPGGRVAVSLADATGHGIGPALVSASCRAYARASLLANGRDGVLDRLNQLLAEDLPSNRFVTFAVVFLDPSNFNVQVLSAGHGPILWYRRVSDKVESIEAQGIPLGMIAAFQYDKATEGRLEQGDFLALVTDGFFEWENPEGEQYGLQRLDEILRESRDLPAADVIERLRESVADFCKGTKQMDDLTAVILKRKVRSPGGNNGQSST